jgi:hypothetical protein
MHKVKQDTSGLLSPGGGNAPGVLLGREGPDPYFESNTVERVIQGQEEPEGCRADPCGREPPGGGQGTRPTEAKGHSRSNLELALERSQNEHSRKSTEGP